MKKNVAELVKIESIDTLYQDACQIIEIGLLAKRIKLVTVARHGFVGGEYSHRLGGQLGGQAGTVTGE